MVETRDRIYEARSLFSSYRYHLTEDTVVTEGTHYGNTFKIKSRLADLDLDYEEHSEPHPLWNVSLGIFFATLAVLFYIAQSETGFASPSPTPFLLGILLLSAGFAIVAPFFMRYSAVSFPNRAHERYRLTIVCHKRSKDDFLSFVAAVHGRCAELAAENPRTDAPA